MTTKHYFSLALAVVLGGLLVYTNRDWFAKRPIQISHRFHAFGSPSAEEGGTVPILFEFNRNLKLTDIKVFSISAIETNRYAQPTWHLISDSNSVPTRGFLYGMNVPGMRPALKGVAADPLEPGLRYRLQIEAGSLKADHDFGLEAN